jgi:hypothetical protein
MGGYGSGWQGSRRTRVEDCLTLSVASLVRRKALVPGARTSGTWCWTYEGEAAAHATIGYEADLRDPADAWLRLHYRVGASRSTTASGSRRRGRPTAGCGGGSSARSRAGTAARRGASPSSTCRRAGATSAAARPTG